VQSSEIIGYGSFLFGFVPTKVDVPFIDADLGHPFFALFIPINALKPRVNGRPFSGSKPVHVAIVLSAGAHSQV